jgi:hypothetical protein
MRPSPIITTVASSSRVQAGGVPLRFSCIPRIDEEPYGKQHEGSDANRQPQRIQAHGSLRRSLVRRRGVLSTISISFIAALVAALGAKGFYLLGHDAHSEGSP